MKIGLWLSTIWMPLLFLIMMGNNAKFKKNIAVGVTLPFEGRSHPEVLAALAQYKKQELGVCIGLIALALPCMLLKPQLSMQLWFVWITLCIIAPYVPYVLCHQRLKVIKEQQGWKQEAQPVTVDMSNLPEFRMLSPWVFVPAVVIALLPLLWDRSAVVVYCVDAAMIALFWVLYRYAFRQKAERVDNNVQVTLALTRIRVCQWSKMWLLSAYAMAGLNVGMSIALYSTLGMAAVLTVFMAVLVSAALYIEMRTRALQEKLTADSGTGYYVDDDDRWLWGMFYYNPNDSRLVVNDRVGTNSTVNLAKPMGKLLFGLIAVCMLTLPAWGLFLGGEVDGEITETQVIVTAGSYGLAFDLDTDYDVTLLEELPQMRRDLGTAMPAVLSGSFSSKEYGKMDVCLNPEAGPWLLVQKGEETWLIGGETEAVTLEIYDLLNH